MPVETISRDRRRKAVWWLLLFLPVAACIVMAALGLATARAAFPGGNGRIVFADRGNRDIRGPIQTIEADGTGLTFLTNDGASPEWSADGSKIVFERASCYCNPHVAVINQDGSGESPVTNMSDLFWEFEPTWSPDDQIAYARVRNPGGDSCWSLWVINQDGSGAREVLTSEQGPCYKRQPAWSPDGSVIAFSGAPTSGSVPTEIYTVRPNGTDLKQLTSSGVDSASQADWSPSGDEIAYHFSRDTSPGGPPDSGGWVFEFRIMAADGTNDRKVRDTAGAYSSVYINDYVMTPAWSPDGKLIAFQNPNSSAGENGLYAVKPDNTRLRPIRVAPRDGELRHTDPDWQPGPVPPPPDPRDCNGVLDEVTVHNLTVKKGRSCTLVDSTVTGRVEVNEDAYFEADNTDIARKVWANRSLSVFIHGGSTVARGVDAHRTARVLALDSFVTDGAVTVSKATELVKVCGMTVAKGLEVRRSGPDIAIGNSAGGCDGNMLGGDVEVANNRIGVRLDIRENAIAGDLRVMQNQGPGGKQVFSNTGGKTLDCRRNDPPFFPFANVGFESRKGQCSGP